MRIVSERVKSMTDGMSKYCGCAMTIDAVQGFNEWYIMLEDHGTNVWKEEMIAGRASAPQITEKTKYESAIENMIAHCKETLISKHNEYATDDDFHNFNVAAKLQDITPEQALMGMATKHIVSVCDLINDSAEGRIVSDDMWREKIGDNINYLLILWAMVTKEK